MDTAGINITHVTLKHTRTIGKIERFHQKLKQILITDVARDAPHWDINSAVMAHNTTYHQTLDFSPSEKFMDVTRITHSTSSLDIRYSNNVAQQTSGHSTLVYQNYPKHKANL